MRQSQLAIAFQGEPGAYSEAALLAYYGSAAQEPVATLPCPSFPEVFDAVESGRATAGLIAIENSLAGSIHQNYDLLMERSLWITGEQYLRVQHCLIAAPGVDMSDLRRVISHPQALAQCAGYLRARGLTAEVFYDTAGSIKHLSESGARDTAGIASRRAAEVYGMNVLAEGIEDNPANFTRFLVIARQPSERAAGSFAPGPLDREYKTSIVFTLPHQPGSLFKALSVFALRDIDLTKIESRPLVGSPFEYRFYVDFVGAAENPAAARALAHLEEYAASMRLLGSYPRHQMA